MTIAYSDAVITDRLQALSRALDANTNPGKIKIYDGSKPGTKGAAITTQTLLVTNYFLKPSNSGVTAGVMALNVNVAVSICVATGLSSWARLTDGADVFVADCDVGVTGSGKEIEISQLQLYVGGEVSPTVGSLVEV